MSFRTNLQYLRAQRNMTQERLAMLLGVSRQAISKWESEKAYPEMDKLLMICDLFGCTLDDLVLGDVSVSASRPDSHGASATGRGTTVGGMTGEDAGSPAHAGNAKGSIGDADEPAHLGAAGAIEPSLTGVPTGETPYGTGSPRPAVHANTATLPQDLTARSTGGWRSSMTSIAAGSRCSSPAALRRSSRRSVSAICLIQATPSSA